MFCSEVCKAHRKDQEICQMVLDLMAKLTPHLQRGSDVSNLVCEQLNDNRKRILHMFGVFWKHADKAYNAQTQLAIVRCLISFIQVRLGVLVFSVLLTVV
jgi:hypothetical protein